MLRYLVPVALAAFSVSANAQAVNVSLSEWKVRTTRDTVKAGPVLFQITNQGVMNHALHVVGEGVDKGTREIAAKAVGTLTLTLKPGTYELYCPMSEDSHKMAGMKKTIVVVADEAKK